MFCKISLTFGHIRVLFTNKKNYKYGPDLLRENRFIELQVAEDFKLKSQSMIYWRRFI